MKYLEFLKNTVVPTVLTYVTLDSYKRQIRGQVREHNILVDQYEIKMEELKHKYMMKETTWNNNNNNLYMTNSERKELIEKKQKNIEIIQNTDSEILKEVLLKENERCDEKISSLDKEISDLIDTVDQIKRNNIFDMLQDCIIYVQ